MNARQAISAAALALAMLAAEARAQQSPAPAVEIDGDDIGGIVTSRFGPEAGVWVIAQTTELGTRFAKLLSRMNGDGTSCRTFPRLITKSWCVVMVSSTRP